MALVRCVVLITRANMPKCGVQLTRASIGTLLGLALACRSPSSDSLGDPRIALALPPDAALAIRTEMRTMLGSLHTILAAAPTDTAAIQSAARAAGMAGAADTALEHLLPARFLTLGTAVHQAFDSLGVAPHDSVIARLGRLTQTCVTCHATYRLTAAGGR